MDYQVFFRHKLLEQVKRVLMAIGMIEIVLEELDYFSKESLHQNCSHSYLESKASMAVY